ncbi:ABC transporter substrate-binding protein [Aestuariirhabdus sp. Z084]|uniref:substrate-binding periplasmic protein n=1 Tax=Aestuariirhabdus haliotis TaxID=2918751 RepID=UPI00201B3821|nr:ABC transporter substrate-binding protein [Aestuariirhabdus haliotis]MCL6414119.1 ABC transporter substrate-binding protein [Aestuariirhabdus haliotis]MCL6418051.1 ABC transporter substrate-binding protein [Aestuariirhabdus haliotis]
MKRLVWAVWGLLFIGTSAVADYKLSLQTENFPPYNFSLNGSNYAKDRDIDGISVRIVREVFKRAKVNHKITLRFPWARIYKKALESEKYGVFSMVRSEEREPLFKWVGPLAPDEWVFFAREGSGIQLSSLEDAKNYVVGGYKGDALTEYLLEQGLEIKQAASDNLNARKLAAGKIDLWAANSFSGRFLATQENVKGIKQVLTFDKVDLYLGLNKSTPDEVVAKLQSAVDAMHKDGTIQKIINDYLGQ